MWAAHAQWYLVAPWQTQRVQCPGARTPSSSRSGFHRRTIATGSETARWGGLLTFDTEGETIIFIERIAVLLAMIRTFLRYSSILLHTNIIRH
jgi:hypothetical protein